MPIPVKMGTNPYKFSVLSSLAMFPVMDLTPLTDKEREFLDLHVLATDPFLALTAHLDGVKSLPRYATLANYVNRIVWSYKEELIKQENPTDRLKFVRYAAEHMPVHAAGSVARDMCKDHDMRVRNAALRIIQQLQFSWLTIPNAGGAPWTKSSMGLANTQRLKDTPPDEAAAARAKYGLPDIPTVGHLRKTLGIKSVKQLGYLLLASDKGNGPYETYTVPKNTGGTRIICAPKPVLKFVQRWILDNIVGKVECHDAAHGFIPTRSTVTNAAPHCGAALLVKFDLKDFFPTVKYFRVMGLFGKLGYRIGDRTYSPDDACEEVAPVLARLCCYTPRPGTWNAAHLPQGAPTSPALTNVLCRRLDKRLSGLAAKCSGAYTRYADDLTFSFAQPRSVSVGRLKWWVDQIVRQEGFLLHEDKFRVFRKSQRQLVTGIVVNERPRLPKEVRRNLRAIVHNCKKNGVGREARGREDFPAWLSGYAAYYNMVQPEGAAMVADVKALLAPH